MGLPQLATSGTGQQLTAYASIIRGPAAQGGDGPREMHVILLDNGRSRLYARPRFRTALRCLRCGACLNACPVYRTVGGHTYNVPYPGPVGAVVMPHLLSAAEYEHLPQASSLCGACTSVCPAQIALHRLILDNRAEADRAHVNDVSWRLMLRLWARVFTSRRLTNLSQALYRRFGGMLRAALPEAVARRIPAAKDRTFAQQWQDHEHE